MIHPYTRLQYINETVGYGVFATQVIPKGTLVYVQDRLDVEVFPSDFEKHSPEMQVHIEKYSYMDEQGIRVISWDFAKFVNHCCNSNTMSTAYGFDIALRDIQVGEEITCEYGMLNVGEEMSLICSKPNCRGILRPSDFEKCHRAWDEQIRAVLPYFNQVDQPLKSLVNAEKLVALQAFLDKAGKYQSILKLKLEKTVFVLPRSYKEFSDN